VERAFKPYRRTFHEFAKHHRPENLHPAGSRTPARAILRWLVRKNIVKEELTTCGRTGNRMAYPIAEGACGGAAPGGIAFRRAGQRSGDHVKRCIYTRPTAFSKKPVAPDAAARSASRCSKAWKTGCRAHRQLHLPVVRHEDDINGFLYLQECAFSNLGFIFNNWGRPGSSRAFSMSSPIGSISLSVGSSGWWCRSSVPKAI
jgi:hypothetical protein